MKNKISLTQQYFGWILKKYTEIHQHEMAKEKYRLVDIKQNMTGENILRIQLTGKSVFFTCTPHEVVTNDELLEGFSKKDLRTIVYLATKTVKKPLYRILYQAFFSKLNKVIFKLGNDTTTSIEKTGDQITLDKSLIRNLDPEDALIVGFATASEQINKDKNEMDRLKRELVDKASE
jgi:hypothetical protein